MSSFRVALIAVALSSASVAAQEHMHTTPGEQIGTVHFPTTCNPSVADQFNRAVAYLHSFEFAASTRAFNDVLAADSTCAIAYWGIALSRWTNPMAPGNRPATQLEQGRQAATAAARLAANASERERGYITADESAFGATSTPC